MSTTKSTAKSTAPKGQVISLSAVVKSKRGRTANIDADLVTEIAKLGKVEEADDVAVLLDGFPALPLDSSLADDAPVKVEQKKLRQRFQVEIRKAWFSHYYNHASTKALPGEFGVSINFNGEGYAQVSRGKMTAPITAAAES